MPKQPSMEKWSDIDQQNEIMAYYVTIKNYIVEEYLARRVNSSYIKSDIKYNIYIIVNSIYIKL